jgi:hypothetical protein
MVDTQQKRFTIPIAPYQPIDAGVQARAGITTTGYQRYEPPAPRPNPYENRTVSEIHAAHGLLDLQKKGGSRNRRRRSRKSRRSKSRRRR